MSGEQNFFVSQPTGSGKSLLFQALPLIWEDVFSFDGFVLVVSPLIALMKNQVIEMKKMNVDALSLNEKMTYEVRLQSSFVENVCNVYMDISILCHSIPTYACVLRVNKIENKWVFISNCKLNLTGFCSVFINKSFLISK